MLKFTPLASLFGFLLITTATANDKTTYDPAWSSVPSTSTVNLSYNVLMSAEQNGAALKSAMQSLTPGDRLVVDDGTWSVDSLLQLGLVGTAASPIRIEAAPGATPILTRPNANQNTLNIGSPSVGPTRFLMIRGFEITGGSIGVRIEDCEDLWIDRCHIHHTGAVTLRASSMDTARLTITRCEFHHSSTMNDTGEGLYLGANFGVFTTHHTVVALNHVHDMFMDQGDGIELKQGSYGCVIAENVVHDTNFPGITVYGTGGNERNTVTGNVVYDTNENAMQVQGEALVTNNIAWGRDRPAFISFDHQDTAIENEIVNNTFITTSGTALRVVNWANRPGMVIANNALYSETGHALFSSGTDLAGVTVAGNMTVGSIQAGTIPSQGVGIGLGDFVGASWDGSSRDAHPTITSVLLEAGVPALAPAVDSSSATRPDLVAAGALEYGTYGNYVGIAQSGANGEPRIVSSAYPVLGGGPISVGLQGAQANSLTALFFFKSMGQIGGPNFLATRTFATTDANGDALVTLQIPSNPALAGLTVEALWVARDLVSPTGLSRTQAACWNL